MTTDCQIQVPRNSEMPPDPRLRQAKLLDSFDSAVDGFGFSQRGFADAFDVPRSTLQGWLDRRDAIDAHPAVVAFFESEVGLRFLQRIVLAAQVVITLSSSGGIRQVCSFLDLSGLGPFVASSYGTQQEAITALEHEIGCFAEAEQARLGAQMAPKPITVVQDETFHPQPCLVAIEPVSGYIPLERYADNREADTWTKAMSEATRGLRVTIVQSTSDECGALVKHAEQGLSAHHSPDLFHVQHEVIKGTSWPMAARVSAAEKRLEEVVAQRTRLEELGGDHPAVDTARHLEEARIAEVSAKARVVEAEGEAERMLFEVRGLSADYHPFDLVTGEARSAELVSRQLEERFAVLLELASRAMLSERSRERIEKAHRVVVKMVATIAFVHAMIGARVEALGLPQPLEKALLERWIPGLYVGLVARKAKRAEDRRTLRGQADAILPTEAERAELLQTVPPKDRELVGLVAQECAQLFQRASSPVEGRNEHLDLFHHGHHRLGTRKLKALTAVHNYLTRRPDGTTAAERFFGRKPRSLFEHLVEQLSMPKKPRTASTQETESPRS
jgi:hypothetical protein